MLIEDFPQRGHKAPEYYFSPVEGSSAGLAQLSSPKVCMQGKSQNAEGRKEDPAKVAEKTSVKRPMPYQDHVP